MLKPVVIDTVVFLEDLGLEMCHFGFRILDELIAAGL
jgi:hypothetical protein